MICCQITEFFFNLEGKICQRKTTQSNKVKVHDTTPDLVIILYADNKILCNINSHKQVAKCVDENIFKTLCLSTIS